MAKAAKKKNGKHTTGKPAAKAKTAKPVAKKAVTAKVAAPKKAAASKDTAAAVGKNVAKGLKGLLKKTIETAKQAAKSTSAKEAAPAPVTGKKGSKGAAAAGEGGKGKDKKAEVIAQLIAKEETEVVLTNAEGKQYCKVHDCDNEATTEGLCRFHYLALWKRNKIKAKILQGGKLDKYIEDLTSKYPDKYLEMLRKDLASEKDFNLIIAEMDVEDSGDEAEAEEETSRFIEEVRGGMPTPDDDESGF